MSVTAVIFLTFVVLLLIGAPITLSLGAAAMGGMIFSGKPLEGLVEIAYTSVNSFPIMALPAFILSGALMESAGISTLRAIDLRGQTSFRYFRSGSPFEYEWMRWMYTEMREIEVGR